MRLAGKSGFRERLFVVLLLSALVLCGLPAPLAYADTAGQDGIVSGAVDTEPEPAEPAGSWKANGHGWWYEFETGSYPCSQWLDLDGTWYWFDSRGYMATGWVSVGGAWYYFDSSGAMATGWRYLGGSWYYLRDSGAMATGWFMVDGPW